MRAAHSILAVIYGLTMTVMLVLIGAFPDGSFPTDKLQRGAFLFAAPLAGMVSIAWDIIRVRRSAGRVARSWYSAALPTVAGTIIGVGTWLILSGRTPHGAGTMRAFDRLLIYSSVYIALFMVFIWHANAARNVGNETDLRAPADIKDGSIR